MMINEAMALCRDTCQEFDRESEKMLAESHRVCMKHCKNLGQLFRFDQNLIFRILERCFHCRIFSPLDAHSQQRRNAGQVTQSALPLLLQTVLWICNRRNLFATPKVRPM